MNSILTNQLINGDCLEIMAGMPDNSVDAIITDPPYYTTNLKFDQEPKIDFTEFFKQAHRICKFEGSIVCFSQQPFTTNLINVNRANFRYEWIWEKSLALGFLNAKKRPLRAHENIILFSEKGFSTYNPQKTRVHNKPVSIKKQKPRVCRHYNQHASTDYKDDGTRYPRSVVKFKNVSRGWDKTAFHPTQKPLDLIRLLVETYTNPGATVFDPFAGSATTAVAAIQTGRNYIAIEKDSDFYVQAKARINQVIAEQELPIGLAA